MICAYPNCGCRIDLPHGQLFPKQGQCPLCEDARTTLALDALEHDLLDLFIRAPRVWGDRKNVIRFEAIKGRFGRLAEHVQTQFRGRCCAHS